MMNLIPYLSFNGNCEEAFKFYEKVLGGQIVFSMTWGQSPPDMQGPPAMKDKIMHATIKVGNQTLQGADSPQFEKPAGMHVTIDLADPAEADRIFGALSAGGNVQMPIMETFWAKRFAVFVDRFGIPWMINCSKPM
jgi:PhnB protein